MNKKTEQNFKNPGSEFRGAPFWAWNCRLDADTMTHQIDYFKEMGLGGFHMHPRTGLDTPYLSKEYMKVIRACVEKAKKEHMIAWLYDEDRWPSGAAGGLVTKDPAYRARYLVFTPRIQTGPIPRTLRYGSSLGYIQRQGKGTFLVAYEVVLENGCLKAYYRLDDEQAEPTHGGRIWYVYEELNADNGWFNNQAYLDTLNPKAVKKFVQTTHEKYYKELADEFGKTVPAIFTDEPQFPHKKTLGFADQDADCVIPYTDDFNETYKAAYGSDFWDTLPEVFWELPDGKASVARYRFHDHVAERFASAFADTIGSWCEKHGIMLTGHMMQEPTLTSQTMALGEAMRSYRSFQQPGIDMLCDRREYSTAKQAQSAKNQYGRKGMLSELYGVTGWDFDFRGHKLQGDWQAALGVTLRVHHLSWASMAGEAKRDYPASIFYQSPWYKEYPYVEDHFARVNVALTSGKPQVRIGVIHPIESMWLAWGPQEQTAAAKEQLEEHFTNTINWLLLGQLDFDFIAESLLPEQQSLQDAAKKVRGTKTFPVGEMAYDVVLVPGCTTLRRSTLERLEAFRKAGGRVIFMGDPAGLVDALPTEEVREFADTCERIPFGRIELLNALEDVREIDIFREDGSRANRYLYQMRAERDGRWVFIAQAGREANIDVPGSEENTIRFPGSWQVEEYNTLTGDHYPLHAEYADGKTQVIRRLYDHDSLLLRLTPAEGKNAVVTEIKKAPESVVQVQKVWDAVPVTLSEPNCLLLDIAEYSLDGEEWAEPEEVLRADNVLRKRLGWPMKNEAYAQPWTRKKTKAVHTLTLRYTVDSRVDVPEVSLAIEAPEELSISWNGEPVEVRTTGYYVDESIKTLTLGELRRGENILEVEMPYRMESNVEWAYLLGDFGVKVSGCHAEVTEPVRKLYFGDWTGQGLPFYGGNVTYRFPVMGNGGECVLQCAKYRNPLLKVAACGEEKGVLAYAPYEVSLGTFEGEREVELTAFGNRVNSFGSVHLCDEKEKWFGPMAWRSTGERWSYEYQLKRTGLLAAPILYLKK